MSATVEQRAGAAAAGGFGSAQRRQFAWITAGAIAVFAALRFLPTGTNLSHMDFRVDPRSGTAIEFCDPLNPQFIPVLSVRSPVVMAVRTIEPATIGREARATITLQTASGKAIAPADLVVTHTRPLHLMLVDPSLSDYQHVHPEPGKTPGEWTFAFTPKQAGVYRIFADFTPAATGRGLYASVDLAVGGGRGDAPALRANTTVEQGGYRFTLTPAQATVRAGQPTDLRFSIQQAAGNPVPLEPVMDAFAHLVAFDEARAGFAHLHPADEPNKPLDPRAPSLSFKLTIPQPGRYVVWAQVNLAGRETFVPFAVEVFSASGGKQD